MVHNYRNTVNILTMTPMTAKPVINIHPAIPMHQNGCFSVSQGLTDKRKILLNPIKG